jgi:ribosomal protein S18 acetylase RimI-like enzyme
MARAKVPNTATKRAMQEVEERKGKRVGTAEELFKDLGWLRQDIEIRPASLNDVPAIARVLVDTWRTTFRGRLSDEFLDGMTYERQEQRHKFYVAHDQIAYFVAVDRSSGNVVGFINSGPNREAEYPGHAGELYALYVRGDYQRRGLGKRLLDALIRRLAQSGLASMMVWVLANTRTAASTSAQADARSRRDRSRSDPTRLRR